MQSQCVIATVIDTSHSIVLSIARDIRCSPQIMYLNVFAQSNDPLDMTAMPEFAQLVSSAETLGLAVPRQPKCLSRNVVVNGLRFHVLEWGVRVAPSIVALHGGGQTAHSWDFVALTLSEQFHVVAIDQRGHGDSEWPRDGERSRSAMADDVAKIVAVLGCEAPVLVGHSMGGLVAMTMAMEHVDTVSRVVLVDVGPAPSAGVRGAIRSAPRRAAEYSSIDAFIDAVVAADPRRDPESLRRTVKYNIMQRADGVFVRKNDARPWGNGPQDPIRWAEDFDDAARIASLERCSVLLVRGAESHILGARAAEAFVHALPNARLVTVPSCGHNVHTQNPVGFIEAVHSFIS